MAKESRQIITVEPGSRFFRIRNRKGKLEALSSYLLQEAESGDGVIFPEELTAHTQLPDVVELRPWGDGGEVRDFSQARLYLSLLRKRYSALFRRPKWEVILSPHYLEAQRVLWKALVREAGFQGTSFGKNLERLAAREVGKSVALFCHWGAGGGDLGLCLGSELIRYRRIELGESWVLGRYCDDVQRRRRKSMELAEIRRLLSTLAGAGVGLEEGRLIEVTVQGERYSWSLAEELQAVLSLLGPIVEAILGFLGSLEPRDQAELFQTGLQLSGGASLLPLLQETLQQLLEIPVSMAHEPAVAVL